MKKTTLERIAGLKEMMDRMERPDVVMAEVNTIMDAINKEQDKEKKDQALSAMAKLALDMMKETEITDIIDIMKKLDRRSSKKVIPVKININQYLDTTIIEIDKKVPYSNLLRIIRKARNTFDQDVKDLYSVRYGVEEKHLIIDYKNEKHNDIIIDMSEWNLSEEVAEVYIEGFVEYIKK